MVLGRVRADDDGDIGVLDLVEGRGHGTRADVFQQGGNGRGMTEPRAVVDIVVAEALADKFLEQIGFFVRALGRAEARNRAGAFVVPAAACQPPGGGVERLFPSRLAEMGVPRSPGSTFSPLAGASSRRISGLVSRCGWAT